MGEVITLFEVTYQLPLSVDDAVPRINEKVIENQILRNTE